MNQELQQPDHADTSGLREDIVEVVPVDQVHPQSSSEYYDMHKLTTPEVYQPDAYDRTLEGYLELLTNLQETQRAVSIDFKQLALQDEGLRQRLAQPGLDAINRELEKVGKKPIEMSALNPHFLAGLAEPAWKDAMPKDPSNDDQIAAWEGFKGQFGDLMADNLEYMYECHAKADALNDDARLRQELQQHRAERVEVIRAATAWRRQEQLKQRYAKQIALVRKQASQSNRSLTAREHQRVGELENSIVSLGDAMLDPNVDREALMGEIDRLDRRDAKKELDSGLLMTDQMKQIIDEALPALCRGEPALFVGETGGAKTALAEYMVTEYFGVEPEVISGYGDVNSYQLMGKSELRAKTAKVQLAEAREEIEAAGVEWEKLSEDKKADMVMGVIEINKNPGVTESPFAPGPLVRAMESGRPVILDEINAMPPELLKRLNKVMQLRPGDIFTVQEDSGREVTVKPGFCIIATANEKSKRYRAVEDLSVEFQNRFGANIYRVRYPDCANGYELPPIENDRLAVATVVDRRGTFPSTIDPNDFDNFVKAAFVSQQVFSGNFGEGFKGYVNTDRIADNQPGLEETVIAPRTMVDILRKVSGSHGEVSLKVACRRFVDGVKNENDRKLLTRILTDHLLLDKDS